VELVRRYLAPKYHETKMHVGFMIFFMRKTFVFIRNTARRSGFERRAKLLDECVGVTWLLAGVCCVYYLRVCVVCSNCECVLCVVIASVCCVYYLRVLDELVLLASALLTCEWAAATTSCCDTARSGFNMECHRRTDGQAPSDERAAWIPRELCVAGIILCNHNPCLVSCARRGRTTSKALSKGNNAFSLPHFTASLVAPGPLHVRHGVLEAAPCSCQHTRSRFTFASAKHLLGSACRQRTWGHRRVCQVSTAMAPNKVLPMQPGGGAGATSLTRGYR
jgi:hypothetical protein